MNSKTYHPQIKKVFKELKREPQTIPQVSVKTEILRANICRHIKFLEGINQVAVFKIGKCPISGYQAKFYTTDRNLFPIEIQLRGI